MVEPKKNKHSKSTFSIGVISDTHIKKDSDPSFLVETVHRHFSGCDAILHAGDLVYMEHFYEIIPDGIALIAVAGNMDPTEIADLLPRKRILEIGGFRIGLTHGHGPPATVYKTALDQFSDENVDAIVFGHSHAPFNKRINDILMFNPGSPTDKRFATYASIGMLDLGRTITGRIIRLG